MGNPPSPALEKLAAAIRRHRKKAGLTQLELANAVPCSDRTISAIEVGRDRPSLEMVVGIEKALDLSEDALVDLYELLNAESLPGWMRDWIVEELRATRLRSFELSTIPGLLQTEDYARALLPGNEAAVRARMDRQSIITADAPLSLRVVIDEMALYRCEGGKQVMYDQLKHLVAIVSEKLTIQIVRADVSTALSGSFVLGTVDGREVAYVETAVRGIVTSSRDDIAELEEAWESVRTHALNQKDSLDFINRTAEERWT